MSLRYAVNDKGERIIPTTSGERALCPLCNSPVLGKCGQIVKWHWAHLSGPDCDPWTKDLTLWHIGWQNFLRDHRKAEIEKPLKTHWASHRADAVLPDGRIIELQRSSISPRDIELREDFYGAKLTWVFDARKAYQEKRIVLYKKEDGKDTFRWKHPRKSISFCKYSKVLDLGGGQLFWIKKIYFDKYCGAFGTLHYWPELGDYEMGET